MHKGFQEVSALLRQGVDTQCFPGAVLVVGYQGSVAYEMAIGQAAITPMPRPMTMDTAFDLASLTKPIATTTALMRLVDAGTVALDSPLAAYVPIKPQPERGSPTIRQLLSHCAGLPAWRPYYQTIDRTWSLAARRHALYGAVHREPLIDPPGAVVRYSDLGFILLGELVEAVSDRPYEDFCQQQIFTALGLEGVAFHPVGELPVSGISYASTEHCPWRGYVLNGEVHDENAWIIGGVAGHAGLFASARQLWRFAQGLLAGLQGRPWVVSTTTVRAFATPQGCPAGSTWALGWDTPTPGHSSSGRYLSADAIGHLGFTGTSLWIDAAKQVVVVLLTNRVHPSRHRQGIAIFRPLLHDAVMQALGLD